jgi:glutamyl-Q tRNA(Asp) synthetase
VVTRFAPSPTGRLHLGHAYSALMAHDFARKHGGAFLLRIEDIDPGRSRAEHVAGILEDLAWLGLSWDGEVVLQSARLSLYREALARLVRQGLLYPCFCTRKEIEAGIAASAAAPHGPDGAVYPGTCRRLPVSERERLVAERPHAWRLDMAAALELFPGEGRGPGATQSVASALPRESCDGLDPGLRRGALTWFDGETEIAADPAAFGDVVLARKDAPVSYHLAVTVDDAAQGVSDVVRGEDLFAATHVHRLLQALLDLPTPRYHHHKLVTDEHGRRLAKRHGAPTLADLRTAGADPADLREKLRAGRLPAGYSAPAT